MKTLKSKTEIMNEVACLTNGKAWNKNETYRVYYNKGYAVIEDDNSINIDAVGRACFQGVKDALESAGHSTHR